MSRARSLAEPGLAVLTVFALCMVLVTIVVAVDRRTVRNERALRFGREAEAVQQTLIARVEELAQRFESAHTFIEVTHPIPLEDYATYMDREVGNRFEIDPAVMVLESVPADEVDALIAREHAFGDTDFSITQFVPRLGDSDLLVITRSANVNDGQPFPFIGAETSVARSLLVPDDLPDDGYAVRVVETEFVHTLTEGLSGGDLALDVDGLPSITSFFVGRVESLDGDHIGWALQFLDSRVVTDQIMVPDGLNVSISVEGIDTPIAAIPGEPAAPLDEAELSEYRSFDTATQGWELDVWADPDFGAATGLFAAKTLWATGAGVSAIVGLASGAWVHYRRRLAGASFELEHARTLASTDPLTGLLNRQGLIDAAREWSTDRAVTLFFIDLDGFKAVNDSRGHEAGDQVLVAVASSLRHSFRHGDLVSRIGGDEFVVFANDDGRARARDQLAGRVVERVAAIDPEISCSLGLASRPAGAETDIKDLLRQADEAMYQAKRSGGDRYVLAPV